MLAICVMATRFQGNKYESHRKHFVRERRRKGKELRQILESISKKFILSLIVEKKVFKHIGYDYLSAILFRMVGP